MRYSILLAFLITTVGCQTTRGDLAPAAEPASPTVRAVQPGAPGSPTRVITGASATRQSTSRHTQADTEFMQGMIAHHAQALEMTAMVRSRSKDEGFRLLSNRIEITQASEIQLMQRWLRERGEDVPMSEAGHHHMGHGHLMPGMLTSEQIAELEAATGAEFERIFLKYMISHHEGALVMVEDLLSKDGAGQDTDIFRFAADVDSDQRMEISRMRGMLSTYQNEDNVENK